MNTKHRLASALLDYELMTLTLKDGTTQDVYIKSVARDSTNDRWFIVSGYTLSGLKPVTYYIETAD